MERYYTFWRRLGAILFDGFLLAIVNYLLHSLVEVQDDTQLFLWTALPIIVTILYNVLLTGLIGQTIGKIVMGIKVLDIGEQNVIGIKRAFYRESVYFVFELLGLGVLGYQLLFGGELSTGMNSMAENIISTSSFLWAALELVTMLFNPKRRALHDYLASSVVISLRGLRFDQHYDQLERQRAL